MYQTNEDYENLKFNIFILKEKKLVLQKYTKIYFPGRKIK